MTNNAHSGPHLLPTVYVLMVYTNHSVHMGHAAEPGLENIGKLIIFFEPLFCAEAKAKLQVFHSVVVSKRSVHHRFECLNTWSPVDGALDED